MNRVLKIYNVNTLKIADCCITELNYQDVFTFKNRDVIYSVIGVNRLPNTRQFIQYRSAKGIIYTHYFYNGSKAVDLFLLGY
jgi:hypothetical protein